MVTRRNFTRLSLAGLGMGLANCTARSQFTSLTPATSFNEAADLSIWWEQGFLPEENEQAIEIVRNWESQSGLTVNLKFLPVDLIDQQLTKLINAGAEPSRLPDIVYSVGVDAGLAPKLSWRDQLMDLSDLVLSVKDRYTSVALSHVYYKNRLREKRSYYALPLWQADDYIHYWGNWVNKIGFQPEDVPKRWEPFWQFWRDAQQDLRSQGHPDLYSIGLCMSAVGFDTYTSLMMFLDAHGVEVVDADGKFLLDAPENRQRMIAALDEYTGFFIDGYVPEAALEWTGGGNNNSFLNGQILMTQNLTLSIPLTQKLPDHPYNQDAAERYRQIVTIERPLKPDGNVLASRKGVKQAIVPKNCAHPQAAKDFLTYLIDPQNLNQLITGFKGRVLPVMPQLFENSLWSDPTDPHLAKALEIYDYPDLMPYEVIHSAFSEVQSQQLWAKTVLNVLRDGASPEQATDRAIAQIKTIWAEWETAV